MTVVGKILNVNQASNIWKLVQRRNDKGNRFSTETGVGRVEKWRKESQKWMVLTAYNKNHSSNFTAKQFQWKLFKIVSGLKKSSSEIFIFQTFISILFRKGTNCGNTNHRATQSVLVHKLCFYLWDLINKRATSHFTLAELDILVPSFLYAYGKNISSQSDIKIPTHKIATCQQLYSIQFQNSQQERFGRENWCHKAKILVKGYLTTFPTSYMRKWLIS